ncbi:hypothetical protein BMAJHU_I0086 [Burkholderia mallei JHU]|nr:hypothetical protein BMAJHU_I0086 [Burkholderia mallei JHU]
MLVVVGRAFRAGLGLARVAFRERALLLAGEVVVEDEFVAVRDEQIRRRVLHADADHALRVLAQLRHERREVRIAADDDERVDVRLRVAEIERVDDEPDVRRILAGLAHVRDFDQLEARLVHRRLERLVAIPIAVRLLDDDAALEQQLLEHGLDVEFLELRVAHAERDVFEVAKERHVDAVLG